MAIFPPEVALKRPLRPGGRGCTGPEGGRKGRKRRSGSGLLQASVPPPSGRKVAGRRPPKTASQTRAGPFFVSAEVPNPPETRLLAKNFSCRKTDRRPPARGDFGQRRRPPQDPIRRPERPANAGPVGLPACGGPVRQMLSGISPVTGPKRIVHMRPASSRTASSAQATSSRNFWTMPFIRRNFLEPGNSLMA